MTINIREQYAKYGRYFRQLRLAYEQKPEVKVSVQLFLTLFTISFFALFALRPTLNTISELYAQIQSEKDISTKLDEKISSLNKAKIAMTQEQKRLFLIDQALPEEPQPDQYLRQVETLAQSFGLTMTSFSVQQVVLFGKQEQKGPETPAKARESLPTDSVHVSLTLTGDYSALSSFLKEMENLRRVIKVNSLSFSTGREDNNLVLTVSGEVPYSRESQ